MDARMSACLYQLDYSRPALDPGRTLPAPSPSRMLLDSAARAMDQAPRTPLQPVPRTPSDLVPRTPADPTLRTMADTMPSTPSDYGFPAREPPKRVWEDTRMYDDVESRRVREEPRRAWDDSRVGYDDPRRAYETSLRTGYEPPREPRRVWEDTSPRTLGGYGESSRTYAEPRFYGESPRPYGESSRTYAEPSRAYAEPSRTFIDPAKSYEFPRTPSDPLPRVSNRLPDLKPTDFAPRALPDLAPRTPSDLPSRMLVDLPPPPRTPSELPPHTPSRALPEYPFTDRARVPLDASRLSPEVHRFSLPREAPRELYERPRAPSRQSPENSRDPSSAPPRTPSDVTSRQSSDFTSQPVPELSTSRHNPRAPPEFHTDTEPPSSPLSDENETADEDERARLSPDAGRRESPVALKRDSPVPMRRGSPAPMRRGSSPIRRESPVVVRHESPVARYESPMARRESLVVRRESPIATKHDSPVATRFELPRTPFEPPTRLEPIRTEFPATPTQREPATPVYRQPTPTRPELPMRADPPTPRQELPPQTPIRHEPPTPRQEFPPPIRTELPPTPRHEPPTPSRLEALAHVAHGDLNIYPVNAPPPAPKTTHSTVPTRRPTLIGTGKAGAKMRPKPSPAKAQPVEPDTFQIRCKCGSNADDRGLTVCCDGCGNWSHLRCYGMVDSDEVSGRTWMCETCERERDKEKDGMDWEHTSEVEEVKDGKNGLDVDMEGASTADEKERDKGKEPIGIKKKEPAGKPKAGTGSAPRPTSGARPNHKAVKSNANPLFPTTKPMTPTIRTIAAPKKTASSSTKVPAKPLSARPSNSNLKARSAAGSSRPSSIDPSPRVRAKPLSPAATPPAPRSPRASSPLLPEPADKAQRESPVDETKAESHAVPSPVPLHTALPPSSPRPPTPPAPSPPKPSVPMNDVDDDDINAAHWATEYDHISSNIVDASLRERLRNFGREHLAKRTESKSEVTPTLTPFTSSEPVFLASSLQKSHVRVKEIKPPPNQHTPTYGVVATESISQGSLVLEYRCALSDAHAYISNKAHQYALLGTGTKYVRLVPAPLDICLDARVMGNEGRFVRCGCWPNAVIRPFICTEGEDQEPEARFGVFALRELKLGEEIVLGWEWAVEHVVHKLVRDEKLGPLPEDEDVLSDSDTKRLWDILDLLRSLSMTCACKPDASNCAISFGRMLLEAVDDAQPAPGLGPLVGYKRYEHGFDPTLHVVSSKTRRGRKSAARERKLRQSAVRPPSPPPKAPTPPPKEPTPPVIKEPTPPRDPTPPVVKESTPPPLAKEPLPASTPSPAKRALGKQSTTSSPLSELSEVDHEAGEESSKRGRPAIVGRGKHRRRIESPSPEDGGIDGRDALSLKVEKPNEPKLEVDGRVNDITQAAQTEAVPMTAGNVEAAIEAPVQSPAEEPHPALRPDSMEPAHEASPNHMAEHFSNGAGDTTGSEQATQDAHDPDEAPKKMSFLDWARRRRATQAADTKDMIPHLSHEHDVHPDTFTSDHPADHVSTSLELSGLSKPGPVASIEPASRSVADLNLDHPATEHRSPPEPERISPSVARAFETVSADVAMQDAVASGYTVPAPVPVPDQPNDPSEPHTSAPETMDIDSVPSRIVPDPNSYSQPIETTSSSSPEVGHSASALVTPQTMPVLLPDVQPSSSPIVSSLARNIEIDPPKPASTDEHIRMDSTRISSQDPSGQPSPVRAPRQSTDAPEEGEITVPRAPVIPRTPINGSPSTISHPLPPSGPRNQVPPTGPRKFPTSPSGSTSGRGGPPYSRPPPSGPSRGTNVSPRAPPSAPRADRRPYNPSPPTGPRERERDRDRERDWERDRDRDRDRERDRDARGRGRGFGPPPRGPSGGWRPARGRGISRGGPWR
ncbi:hypothetical protein ACGC1H_004157 [Rhizoctonia solani]